MKSIEVTGKNVKDAVERGAAQLGCDQNDLDIQILEMGSAGLFGLFGKPAKVRLTLKEEEKDLDITSLFSERPEKKKEPKEPKQPKPAENKQKPKAEKAEKPQKPEKEAPAKKQEAPVLPETEADEAEESAPEAQAKPRKEGSRRRRRGKGGNRAENGEKPQAVEPVAIDTAPVFEAEPFEPIPEEQWSENAVKARDFLKGLTERMGVPCEFAIAEKEDGMRVVLSGENMSILIGRRGETLDAIQYLTSLYINRDREEYLRVTLDTENYRAKREEALRKLAARMAGRCKKNGRRVALEPMNPYERRILHSALQNDPDVTTHSEGEEPYRRVIITLK